MSKKTKRSSKSENKAESPLKEVTEMQSATPAEPGETEQEKPSDQGNQLLNCSGSMVKSATQTIGELGGEIGHRVSETGEAIVKSSLDVGGAIGHRVSETGEALVKSSVDAGEAIGHTASQLGQTASQLGQTAAQTGGTVLKVATDLGNAAFKQSHWLIDKTTSGTGQAVAFVGDSPLIRKLVSALKLDWLPGISDQVDLTRATEAVRKLQQEHPNESPSQIAHRIMVEKAVYRRRGGLSDQFGARRSDRPAGG
ncbi:hypothetical protein K9N68_08000 [Kovacikia minuta CCNUW1]|uniref:hypothetical protein n=1 Tax=Kovacikia minuta TaxID=2931930 RepID=UPI001CC91F02|nr:hypothetical protein [Kovacikia minuta]UBF27836.1 hypothetical protein K9N68_08000 [Kovacikia minuta CCNUW1]